MTKETLWASSMQQTVECWKDYKNQQSQFRDCKGQDLSIPVWNIELLKDWQMERNKIQGAYKD